LYENAFVLLFKILEDQLGKKKEELQEVEARIQ
jgi:hypothetical protein